MLENVITYLHHFQLWVQNEGWSPSFVGQKIVIHIIIDILNIYEKTSNYCKIRRNDSQIKNLLIYLSLKLRLKIIYYSKPT